MILPSLSCEATYCLSSTILPVVQRLDVPVVVLNLQPAPAIDYERLNALCDRGRMTGMWLANCQACSAPEIASVLARSGRRCAFVTGWLGDPVAGRQIDAWIAAAGVRAGMRRNRLGVLGHYYGGMLDVYTDLTRQSAVFRTHVELIEMCELHALREAVTDAETAARIAEFRTAFDVSPECGQAELERAARTSVALDRLVEAHGLGSMAYYYEGASGNDYERIVTSVIAGNTLLTGRGIPVAGECEVKNAQAMKILSLLGAGRSFSEFYALDFDDDIVMLGHDGPAHSAIAEGAVGLVPLPLYHGKPGKGLSPTASLVDAFELNQLSDLNLYDYLDDIRDRTGMPPVDRTKYASQTKLRELMRRERRVELAFEGHRLFDIRRWRIAEQVMNGPVYGATPPGADDRYLAQTRVFNPGRDYLWPIPVGEMNTNTGMEQNPGY